MELSDPQLVKELKWRGLLHFIDYDFENSIEWKQYQQDHKDSQEDIDITKRKFYLEFIDK